MSVAPLRRINYSIRDGGYCRIEAVLKLNDVSPLDAKHSDFVSLSNNLHLCGDSELDKYLVFAKWLNFSRY